MTNTLKHTPAPWHKNGKGQILSARGDVIASGVYGADADLIKTAPKLLSTVEKLAWFLENVNDDTPNKSELFFEARELWRNAIAEATEGK